GINPRLSQRMRDADALLVIGSRLGDIETQGYTIPDPTAPGKAIYHIHPDADEPGRVYHPDRAIICDAPGFVAALAAQPAICSIDPEWTSGARADYDAWTKPQETPGDVKLEQVVAWLS